MPLSDSQLSSHLAVAIDHAVLICGSCHFVQEAFEPEFPSWQELSKKTVGLKVSISTDENHTSAKQAKAISYLI